MQGSEDTIILIFVVSSLIALVLVLLVVVFVVVYQRRMSRQKAHIKQMEVEFQKELLRQAFLSQEEERSRIAKDLHDGVGAMLSTVRLFASKLADHPDPESPKGKWEVTTMETIDETINTVRRISHDLLPPTLERFGLAFALKSMAEKLNSSGKIKMVFQENPSWSRLSPDVELSLYRIVQELLNNTLKHAEATQIQLQLESGTGMPSLTYADNGKGIPPELLEGLNPKGLGLRNIESRASQFGAFAEWHSEPGKGMRIQIKLPTESPITNPITT